jgi:hypothetical protein
VAGEWPTDADPSQIEVIRATVTARTQHSKEITSCYVSDTFWLLTSPDQFSKVTLWEGPVRWVAGKG